ncbi:MAG TPA: hypothetical protein VNB24_01570 [Acidimicrobiales bacterium]|nr:hypothetical protein [Acidimicrobiales bacterium]
MPVTPAVRLEPGERKAALRQVAGRIPASSPVPAAERRLEVRGAAAALFPSGIRKGTAVALPSPRPALDAAALRLTLALAAGTTPVDGWVAAVGVPALGVVAAAEAGLPLDRLVFLAAPESTWGTVTIAAVDAFDVVVVNAPARPRAAEVRRLAARARERGAVLLVTGTGARAWPAEAHAAVASATWDGLGSGHGHLESCRLTVALEGRGGIRSRRVELVA